MTMKRKLITALFGTLMMQALTPAHANSDDAWPTQPLRWVVGFAPGGTADVLTRIAAEQLAGELGQAVVVENRPGASGAIALKAVAQIAADNPALITVPGPIIYPRPEPSIGDELDPVMLLAQGPMIVVGPASNLQESLEDVIEDVRNQPDKWSYATSGIGTSQHLAGELINHYAGINMLQVPYKGGGQAVADVVGGQVPLAILGPTPVLPHIRSGALKAYAVTTSYRLAALPDTPTVQEAGISNYDATQWFAAAISPGVDPKHINTLNDILRRVVETPAFQEAVAAAGMVTSPGTPDELGRFVLDDDKRWQAVAQQAGILVD